MDMMRVLSAALLLALFLSCGGELPPTVPTELSVSAASAVQINLSWSASTDDVKMGGYKVYRDGSLAGVSNATSYSDGGLQGGRKYCYKVSAYDVKGNESAKCAEQCVETPPDSSAPTTPTGLSASAVGESAINLSWGKSTDNAHLSGYKVYRGGQLVASATSTSYSDSGLSAGTKYCYNVSAFDSSENESAQSGEACATTASGLISSLAAYAVAPGRIDLSWSASTETGVVGYTVYRNGSHIATATTPKYTDTGLPSGVLQTYRVHVYFSSGAESAAYAEVAAKPLSWSVSTVDSTGDAGQYSSLALDGNGKAHISYVESIVGNLKYATNSSGSFSTSTLDAAFDVIKHTSIALDSNGKAHISYQHGDDSNPAADADLKYATNKSGAFSASVIDASGADGVHAGGFSSIAVDGSGRVHIGYHDYTMTTGGLKYATDSYGSWLSETVGSSANGTGLYVSLKVDSSGRAHIGYFECLEKTSVGGNFICTNGLLKYAKGFFGSWSVESVDISRYVGLYSSLALDENGKAHIAYYDSPSGNLKYATNASGSWVAATIDSPGDVGKYASVAISSSGRVHIAYYDATNGDLKYATKDSSGAWVASTVESGGDVGRYSSIAVDSSDRVHVSYYDATNGDLKYAVAETAF